MTALDERTAPGVVGLVGALAGVDRAPAITLVIDRSDPAGEPCAWERGCHSVPGVTVPLRFLTEDRPVMAAVLAHEVAHHRPDSPPGWQWPDWVAGAALVPLAVEAVAVWVGAPKSVQAVLLAAAAVLYVAARLGSRYLSRREELAADAYAVLLLDAVGLPGLDCTRAALEQAAGEEMRRDRWLWPFSTHPTAAQRLAAL